MKKNTPWKIILSVFYVFSFFLYGCQPEVLNTTTVPQRATDTPSPVVVSTITPSPSPSATETPTLVPDSDFIKGAWFVDWGLGDGVATRDGEIVLRDIIQPLGAQWIALTVPCSMDVKDPGNIECNSDKSMFDADVERVTHTAHSLGLRVALFPFALDVAGVPGNWSAGLDFGSSTQNWDLYFAAYTEQLLHYAEIAEQNRVDLLMVGGEQTGAQPQEEHWRTLIARIRDVYHGPITYNAWCQHFRTVKWWDAVDYIGINFYCFPLSNSQNPSVEDVKANYLKFLQMVKSETRVWNKQIIFTEIGYESLNGVANIVPFGVSPVRLDVEEQGILVQGFFEALQEFGNEDQWLKGTFWYNFTSNPLLGGPGDMNFTPHGKPAEEFLRSFYTGQPVGTPQPGASQVEEDVIEASYWFFRDKFENYARFGPWAGEQKQSVIGDPLGKRGNVIAIQKANHWEGLHLFVSELDTRNYDFLELYLYSPHYEPNLELRFDDVSGVYIPRRLYIRSYMDHEPLLNNSWHRIQVPLDLIFPSDRLDIHSQISSIYFLHMWPGQPEPLNFFLDDIRLIKMK